MKRQERTIYVYDAAGTGEAELMGCLYSENYRAEELCSFAYDENYLLRHGGTTPLDPHLELYAGRQQLAGSAALFGLFADSCPGEWGKALLKKLETERAQREDRKPTLLHECDYLVGVCDEIRHGALRFRRQPDGKFVAPGGILAMPPLSSLRTLEKTVNQWERNEKPLTGREFLSLLASGGALDGNRPKVTVRSPDGSLWMAKFPSVNDEWDVGAWEYVLNDLAHRCSLRVPEAMKFRFSAYGTTFLTRRFDREGEKRVHFLSAATLLGLAPGSERDTKLSYTDLAEIIRARGASPKEDLEELWRRMVFYIAVSNTEDSITNFGFLLQGNGWRLAPAFGMHPNPWGRPLCLSVAGEGTATVAKAVECAKYFGLPQMKALQEANAICEIVCTEWRASAAKCGISPAEIDAMRPAFAP